ncbi:MAG: 30S ribosomal protein S3 [Defluviitaleaceae bacterium]|nr:30S ribosomal protein S3 [Defluviitaleaceae bacterium]
MGQKVSPHGLRLGIVKEWDSVWYAEKDFAKFLAEDDKLRKYIKKRLYAAGISRITISRTNERVRITIFAGKPGIIIGQKGQAIAQLSADIQKLSEQKVLVNIEEVKRPELDSQLVAETIAKDLENRVTFRRAMKQAISRTMKMGAKGVKTSASGRLGGAEIARTEHYHEGTIPLQTLRADIDYGFAEANTTYGKIGVKVWIYKGEVLPGKERARPERTERPDRPRGDRPPRGDRNDRNRGDRRGGPGGGHGGRPGGRPSGPSGDNRGREGGRV